MTDTTENDYVMAIYQHAAELLDSGKSPEDVVANLVEQGLDAESANTVLNSIIEGRLEHKNAQAKKNILYGSLWALGGTLVTLATLSAAKGGGSYVVAWGAIVLGAVQLLQGLFQYKKTS